MGIRTLSQKRRIGADRAALAEARPPRARVADDDLSPMQAQILDLQRTAGNLAMSRAIGRGSAPRGLLQGSAPRGLLQRSPLSGVADWVGDRLGDAFDTRPNEACLDAREDLEDFMSQEYSTEDFHPSTGRGLFDARYSPRSGDLTITVGITFNFQNGNPADPTWVASVGGPAKAATYTADQFTWTDDEKEDWKSTAISMVQSHWGQRYTFFTQRPCWEGLPPVNVTIQVVERPGTGAGKSHFVTSVTKWPTEPGLEESVTPPGRADQSTARFHESGSDGITTPDSDHRTRTTASRARYGQVDTDNPGVILFAQGSAEVSAADRAKLATFGATLGAPDMPPFPVTVTGHASSEGTEERNMQLSETRAHNVANAIVTGGAKKQPTVVAEGERGASLTPEWRRVNITVGAFEADQTTILHEFGHMFGLGDEYPTPDGGARDVGTRVAHSALAERLIPGQQPILAHHDEGIMSNGELIRPHHYVTFLEVLGKMTGTEGTWDVRPGPGSAPRGPGDFPTPPPGGPVAV
jgi:outer membrane protein OmpA-like peptidoglycan-associated protein